MKQPIKLTEAIFPMPVLLVATYNEDGTVDVMNAAWGTMLDRGRVALNLTETHRTVENIKRRKGFVVHIADSAHVVEADWFGVVSGKTEKDKFAITKISLATEEIFNEIWRQRNAAKAENRSGTRPFFPRFVTCGSVSGPAHSNSACCAEDSRRSQAQPVHIT